MAFSIHGRIFEDDVNNVYIVGSHQFALYYWTKAVWRKKLSLDSLLIHIDLHSDLLDPRLHNLCLQSPQSIYDLIENRSITFDTFIRPALDMRIVSEIAFCCNPNQQNDFGGFLNHKCPSRIVQLLSQYRNGAMLSEYEASICKKVMEGSFILDVDMDYFFDFKSNGFELTLKQEEVIIQDIEAINSLFDLARITTIATSPDFIWDLNLRLYLQKLFVRYFRIKLDFQEMPGSM